MQTIIEDKLQKAFEPAFLSVENESHRHRVPEASETHFKVVLVSVMFEGNMPVKRHQLVYKVLCSEVKEIHALALHTFTPKEWEQHSSPIVSSPCSHK